MKRYVIIVFFIQAFSLFGQDLHQVKQKKDSVLAFKERIAQLFTDTADLNGRSDYCYLILLPPGICPRCEGLIPPSVERIKKYDSTARIIISASFPRMSSLIMYLAEHGLNADAFWLREGEDDQILDDFCFSTGFMQVPYLTKINIHSGLLVYSAAYLGMNLNDSLIREIVAVRDNSDFIIEDCPGESDAKSEERVYDPLLFPADSILLTDTMAGIPSGITGMSINQDASSFLFHDRLTLDILYYEKVDRDQAVLRTILQPGEKEKNLFVDKNMPEKILLFLDRAGILRSMYFNADFNGNSKILISASLPYVYMEDEESVSYYNEAVILEKEIASGEIDRILRINTDTNSGFVIDHTNFKITSNDGSFAIPVQKGFPSVGTEIDLNQNDTVQNPFLEGFYKSAPLFQRYISDSDYLAPGDFIGEIDSIYGVYQLGYSFVSPFYKERHDTVLLSSGTSGKLKLYVRDSLLNTLQVFDVKIDSSRIAFEKKESEPLEYILSFSDFFENSIVDAEILGDNLYVLIKGENSYYLKQFNRMKPYKVPYYLPEYFGKEKLKVARFVKTPQNLLQIYAVYESSRESKIYIFSIPAEN